MSVLLVCRRIFGGTRCVNTRLSSKKPLIKEASVTEKSDSTSPSSVSIDEETIKHLERLSLVDFANKRGITRLEEAINFASKLEAVDTTGVEPLVSVLENEILYLREDQVTEENDVRVVMSTATEKEEDYYVAPPGNIPLISRDPNDL